MIHVNGTEYATPREAAHELKIAPSTIYTWIRTNQVKILPPDKREEITKKYKYLVDMASLREKHQQSYIGV